MSADDFQTKYASVMESMLKSAIAETTKLFENMVDELKAEISQIRKENEDLKSKCFQYEVAKSQPVDRAEESDPQPGQSDDSGKCDSSIQCDLVPYRTVLVEECQPLVEFPQQNQEQQYTHDSVGYTWQEHNYVSNGCRDPKMAFVHVKQEESYSGSDFMQSSLKQEEEESGLISEQLLTKTGAPVRVEHEGSRSGKGSSIEPISSSQKRDATQMVLQLPCFRTDGSPQVAQNQPSGLNHSLVISLTDAFREDFKEENEVYQMTTKMGTSEDLRTQKQQLVPEEYHLDKASLPNRQTEGTVKPHGDVACTTGQLAESELIRKEVAYEEIKGNLADVVADPNPAPTRRGRPPKKRNEKHIFLKTQKKVGIRAAANASPSGASASEVLETYSSFSPPGKWNANTPAKEKQSKTGSSPRNQPPLKSSQLFLEVEKERTQVRVFRASSASKTTNPPQSESPQAPSGLLKGTQSSVSLQDAMLLIEAMNQSTHENAFSLTQVTSQPQTHFAPLAGPTENLAAQQSPLVEIHHTTDTLDVSSNMTGTGLSNDTMLQNEEIIPQQPHVPIPNNATLPVLSALSSTAATQTVIQSLPLPRIKVGAPTNVPRTIIILPRPALSYSSPNTLEASKTQSSAVDSTASQMILTAPPSPGLELSCEKPSHSSNTPKTIKVTYKKLDPVSPTQSTTILADQHLLISASKKLTIVPKSLLAVRRDIAEQEAPVSDPEPEATVYNPEPETLVNTLEPEAPVSTLEPETSVDTLEPEAPTNTIEPEAPVSTLEPETSVDTLEPEAPVYTPESKTPANTLEPETSVNTVEPEATIYTPEPKAHVDSPEPEAHVSTPEPKAHVSTPEPKAHVSTPEPEAHVSTPEPEAHVGTPEPEAHVSTPEPKAHVSTPEPKAHVSTPEPKAHVSTPEPEAHVGTPEPEAHVSTPEPEAHVSTPEPEAQINTLEPETYFDTPEPETYFDTPEPEAHVSTPEPKAQIDTSEPEAHVDFPEPDADVSLSTQLNVMSQEPSLTAADTTSLHKKNNTAGGARYSNQSAAVFGPFNPLADISSSTEMSVKEVQTLVSSILPSTTEQKFCAVVRLTRLPFPVSTKESLSVSALQAKGFSFISEKPSKPSISLSVLSDMKAGRGSQAVAGKITALSCEPLTFNHQTADLAQDAILSENEEDQKEDLGLPTSVNPDDVSDPRFRITKTEFLEQLSVTLQKKSSSNKSLDASESRTSDQQKYSLVSRLRSRLKPLLKARRIAAEQVTDNQTESCVKTPKKPRLDSDNLNVNKTTKESVSARKLDVSDDATSLNTVTTTRKSGHCKVDDSPTKIVCEKVFVSLKKFDSTSACTAKSFKRLCSDTDIGSSSKKTKSSSTSLKKSTAAVASPEKTTIVKEGNTNLQESGSPSGSTFIKVSPCTKLFKRESSSFSPGRCSISKVNARERNMSESRFPLTKDHKKVKNATSPESTQRLTPEKKPKLVKGCQTTIMGKLAKTARIRGRNKAKSSNSEKPKRQNKNNWVVKKCSAKIWYPPTLPPDELPSTEIIKAPRLKVEYRVPVIPLNPEPIVSPLQPLSFIGRHLLRHQCGECGRVFNSGNALESHVSLHNLNRPFTCKLCAKYFPDAITFKRHDRVHRNGRIYVCQTCGKGFVYRFGLSKHVQMVHGRIKPFICQVCNKGFFNKRDVEIHARIHTGEKPFQCDICERRFTRKVELNVHLRWHNGEKRHWCSYCGKGFLDANNLKRHKYIHTGEKPFSCPFCPKNFTQTGHLKKHVQSMHRDARL